MSWCPDCGAIRQMQPIEGGNGVEAKWLRWIKPRGWDRALRAALEQESGR